MKRRLKISPWAQVILHIVFGVFYTANLGGLIPEDHTGKWITVVVGQVQSVLAIYGIFSPSPSGKAIGSSKTKVDQR